MNLKEDNSFFTHHFRNFQNTWMNSILFDCIKNWISNIGIGYITPKIIVYVENGYDFTKNVLNVSQFFIICNCFITLFYVIVLLHFLWKSFSEKGGLIVFQTFLLSVTILLFKFPKLHKLFVMKLKLFDRINFSRSMLVKYLQKDFS